VQLHRHPNVVLVSADGVIVFVKVKIQIREGVVM
jgi:hypothetical protein